MEQQIQITVSDRAMQQLVELKRQLGVETITEVIQLSVSTARYLEKEWQQGNEVIIRNSRNKNETVLVPRR